MPPKKNSTPVKPPEGSTIIHEESEDMYFRVSQLEESMEQNMGNLQKRMEKKLEEGMDRIFNLIQHKEEKIPNGDNVGQGTHADRNSSHLSNHPLVSILLEGLILTLEVIRDGSHGVFNFPRLT